jgi:lipopolysaccharide transport system permease protein
MTPGIHPSAVWMLPVLVVIMAVMALGMGIIFSSLTTKYRDLRFLLSFGIQLAMYLSPVIISTNGLSATYRYLLLANPMSAVINTARYELLGVGSFSIGALLYSAGFAVVVLIFGLKLFATVERNVMDTV